MKQHPVPERLPLDKIQEQVPQLVALCENMVEDLAQAIEEDRLHDDLVSDWKYWFYETWMDAVYGSQYWDWLNQYR